jgi:hypothetical protein
MAPKGGPLRWIETLVAEPSDDSCRTDWPFMRNEGGYPRMHWNGRARPSHHVVLELTGRPQVHSSQQGRHLCGNGHLGCLNPSHLAWGTRPENEADKLLHGTSNRGERCGAAKLTVDQVRAIRASSESRKVLASRYGVTAGAIGDILRRSKWAWLD